MKAFISGLVLGIVFCGAGFWYLGDHTLRVDVGRAGDSVKDAAVKTKALVEEKADSLNLSTTNIKAELAQVGAIIRRKAVAAEHAVADATADARITAAIKAKLVADPDLSALSISVSTTDGLVTMSGTATSPENVHKAIQLAWETDGVYQVISTIQVKE